MITPIIGLITTASENNEEGILFYEDNSKIYILDVYPTSPFASTELRSGMLVVSVNNVPCDEATVDFVTKITSESTGILKILAHHDSNTMAPLSEVPVAIASEAPPDSTTTPLDDIPVASPHSTTTSPSDIPVASPDSTTTSPSDIPVATPSALTTNPIVQGTMVTEQQIQARAVQRQLAVDRPPPPGLRWGGVWGEINDIGWKSMVLVVVGCIIVGPLWCLILCCAIDKKKGYCVDGIIYDKNGLYLAEERDAIFTPFSPVERTIEIQN